MDLPFALPEDERGCARLLAAWRWPRGVRCARCGRADPYHLHTRPRVFECRGCGRHTSVTAGTALHGSKVPLRSWLRAVVLHTRGVSALRLASELGVTYETAFQLLHKVRRVLEDEFPQFIPDPDGLDLTRVGSSTLRLCPPWQGPKRGARTFVCYGVGREWYYGAYFDERGQRLFHAAQDEMPVDRRWEANRRAHAARTALRGTYRAVSARWIERYFAERSTAEACWPATSRLRRLLRAPPRAWWRVVPG